MSFLVRGGTTLFPRQPVRHWRIMWYHICSVCIPTIVQRTVWQLRWYECVASPVTLVSLVQNKRHNRWTSARELRLCIGVLGVSAANAQVMLGGSRSDPPTPWLVGITRIGNGRGGPTCAFHFGPCLHASRSGNGSCCMLGSDARLVTCGNSNKVQSCYASTCSATNERGVNIISRHCAAVIS